MGATGEMMDISHSRYRELANLLRERINGRCFIYDQTIDIMDGCLCYSLKVSAIIYYRTITAQEGNWSEMSDVVPVWWEFRSYECEGLVERSNNFSFEDLKQYL